MMVCHVGSWNFNLRLYKIWFLFFRWVLKCHACYEVTKEAGRIFCPKCGNGGTLRKVAVTVGENGVVLSDRKQHISIRGTKVNILTKSINSNTFLSSNHCLEITTLYSFLFQCLKVEETLSLRILSSVKISFHISYYIQRQRRNLLARYTIDSHCSCFTSLITQFECVVFFREMAFF